MILAILQARMGSHRLPGKVLKKIKGKTLLELYLNRVKPSKLIDQIVVATTDRKEDNVIEEITEQLGFECFRGSENDLLDRYYQCACKYNAKIIVRITPDDPFVDHQIVDHGISIFLENEVDFVTNHLTPTFPEGLDVEIYSLETLRKLWHQAELLSEREHVYPYIQNHPEEFRIINFTQEQDSSHLRWTIDYECDYEMTKVIYDHLYDQKHVFLQEDILQLLQKHPEIAEINTHIQRKEGVNRTKVEDGNIKIKEEHGTK
jgi:spore coat polysaccharide biosynthesis protein SpsF (cytidylyltransferase family)